jgi:hypothetical protein
MGPPYQPGYSSPMKKLFGTPERKTAGIAPQARYFQNFQQQPVQPPSPYSPAPMGMQRMPAGPGQAAMPSAADRLLGDQYTYPSQMGRAGGYGGQPGMATASALANRRQAGAPPMSDASAIPPGHPLYGLSSDEQLKMLDNLRQRASQPMMNSQQYAAANGYGPTQTINGMQFDQSGNRILAQEGGQRVLSQADYSPLLKDAGFQRPADDVQLLREGSPLQRLMQGTATQQYSNSGRAQAAQDPLGGIAKMMPASNPNAILDRTNNTSGGRRYGMPQGQLGENGETIHQAYQAQLVVPPNGERSYYRQAPTPTDFAGSATSQSEADAKRMATLKRMEAQGRGYVGTNGEFIGFGDGSEKAQAYAAAARDNPNIVRGRLAAGGYTTPTTLTPDQLADNRTSMIQRMAGQREKAMARVQELAQMRTADRRARMNPSPLDRLMANNPQAALQMQAMQMQQQHQMAMQNADNQGRLAIADREAQAAMERANIGGFVGALGANVPEDRAAAMFGRQLPPGMKQPGQAPKYAAGNFNGVDKATYDYLKEQAENADDDYLLGIMGEMQIPAELQEGLLGAVKPNFWRNAKAGAAGNGAAAKPNGGPGWGPFGPTGDLRKALPKSWGPMGPKWNS